MKQADLVLSINKGLRDYMIQMGAQKEKTEVIRTGIDFERFNPDLDGSAVREKLGITEDDIVLFFMGWLYDFWIERSSRWKWQISRNNWNKLISEFERMYT